MQNPFPRNSLSQTDTFDVIDGIEDITFPSTVLNRGVLYYSPRLTQGDFLQVTSSFQIHSLNFESNIREKKSEGTIDPDVSGGTT